LNLGGYDAAGNLTVGTAYCRVYDAEGRVTQVLTPAPSCGTVLATYVYDAEGKRIEKIVGASQTHYWYGNSGQVLGEWSQAGSIQNDYLYLGGQMLAQYTPTTTYFAHVDHLSSTRLLTSVSGATLECDDYLPFGEQLSYSGSHPCSNTGDTTHKFTGKEFDAETGIDNFGARYYNQVMGRFMTPDWDAKPVTVPYAHFGNPQSLNLYVYVSNNPLTFADPDGHMPGTAAPGVGCVSMECEATEESEAAPGQGGGLQHRSDGLTVTVTSGHTDPVTGDPSAQAGAGFTVHLQSKTNFAPGDLTVTAELHFDSDTKVKSGTSVLLGAVAEGGSTTVGGKPSSATSNSLSVDVRPYNQSGSFGGGKSDQSGHITFIVIDSQGNTQRASLSVMIRSKDVPGGLPEPGAAFNQRLTVPIPKP
jgi:RHS repeat-associated protein